MGNVIVSDEKEYSNEIVARYLKLFKLIVLSKKEYTINLGAFNRMIMERLSLRENIVIRLIYGLGYCCAECWRKGFIPPEVDDGDVKLNEKVIPSKVPSEEYFKPHSRNGVAAIFNINPESIRTAHNNAIKKLRHPGSLGIINGEVVENVLFIKDFGYIRKEYLKYPVYLYVKHDAHFKELVKELEKMGVEVHNPIAEMNEKTTDRSVVELFESKIVKALVNEAGCYKLSDIAKLSSYDLLSVKGIGYRAYQTIIEKMRENDFELL